MTSNGTETGTTGTALPRQRELLGGLRRNPPRKVQPRPEPSARLTTARRDPKDTP